MSELARVVTVSAKVDEGLRKRMTELGIRPSDVIRRALEEAVEQKSRQLILERAKETSAIARKVSREDWTRAIRESRDSR